MREKSVVFPAPFGPTSPMRSWRFTCNDTSANNVRPPNALVNPLMVSIRNAGWCLEEVCDASAQFVTRPAVRRSGGQAYKTLRQVNQSFVLLCGYKTEDRRPKSSASGGTLAAAVQGSTESRPTMTPSFDFH